MDSGIGSLPDLPQRACSFSRRGRPSQERLVSAKPLSGPEPTRSHWPAVAAAAPVESIPEPVARGATARVAAASKDRRGRSARRLRLRSSPMTRSPACKLITRTVQLRNDLRDYLNRRRAVDDASLHGVHTKPVGVETPRFVQCPRCSRETAADSTFCESCAALLDLRCPGCGATSPVAARFCRNCGRALAAVAAGARAAESAAVDAAGASPGTIPAQGEGRASASSRSCSAISSTRRPWLSVSIPRT